MAKQQEKDPASNALGYQARQLGKAAEKSPEKITDVSDVVRKLSAISAFDTSQAAAAAKQAKDEAADERNRVMAPLLAEARRKLADAESMTKEHQAFVDQLAGLNWPAIRERIKVRTIPGSLASSVTRVALLQRVVEEAQQILNGSDQELAGTLREAESFTSTDPQEFQRVVGYLHFHLRGDRGESIRNKISAIRSLLAQIGEDVESGEGTEQPARPEPLDLDRRERGTAVPPTMWPATPYTPPAAAEEK